MKPSMPMFSGMWSSSYQRSPSSSHPGRATRETISSASVLWSYMAALVLELRQDVTTEQLDRFHHLVVRDVVGVDEAHQQLAAGGLVALGDFDASLGVACHHGALAAQRVEAHRIPDLRGAVLGLHLHVRVRAHVGAGILQPTVEVGHEPAAGAAVPLE